MAGFGGAIFAFMAITAAPPATAQGERETASMASRGAEDRATLSRIEHYLDKLRSMRTNFVQVASSGAVAEGILYLQRPGRMRIEYAPPSVLRIFADGHWLIYFDRELDELTYLPLEDTPAGLLVRDRIALSGDITVSRIERGGGTLRVTLHKAGKADFGSITLVFTDAPIALKQWVVTDAQGITTRVTLVKPEFNVALDAKLFEFKDTPLTPSDQH